MDNNNFLKIIYFDEAFVADFMQIIAGGELDIPLRRSRQSGVARATCPD